MDFEFVKLNWHLFAAVAVVIALLALEPVRKRSSGIRSVSALDLPRVMTHEKGIVVDISEPKHYTAGHIPKSRNIPLSRIDNDINTISKFKSKPVVITCPTGHRSSKAAKVLKKNDFSDIRILHGGFAAWTKENMPVEKG